MLAEAVQQYAIPDKGIVTRLKEHPELVKRLKHAQVTEEFEKMNISIEVVTAEIIKEAEGLFTQHGLLTNDSITFFLLFLLIKLFFPFAMLKGRLKEKFGYPCLDEKIRH